MVQGVEALCSERHVKLVTRASYSNHCRRIVPALLEVLNFQCNNDLHRPVMDALALLEKYRGHKSSVFPASEKVPSDGVVSVDQPGSLDRYLVRPIGRIAIAVDSTVRPSRILSLMSTSQFGGTVFAPTAWQMRL